MQVVWISVSAWKALCPWGCGFLSGCSSTFNTKAQGGIGDRCVVEEKVKIIGQGTTQSSCDASDALGPAALHLSQSTLIFVSFTGRLRQRGERERFRLGRVLLVGERV